MMTATDTRVTVTSLEQMATGPNIKFWSVSTTPAGNLAYYKILRLIGLFGVFDITGR
ncbi:MAG: hypothetical protein SFH39_12235 [Candidatus Magnetobacterium sp. LHC-1]|nr:hypothetical protein [Nitrospirota bacterium]